MTASPAQRPGVQVLIMIAIALLRHGRQQRISGTREQRAASCRPITMSCQRRWLASRAKNARRCRGVVWWCVTGGVRPHFHPQKQTQTQLCADFWRPVRLFWPFGPFANWGQYGSAAKSCQKLGRKKDNLNINCQNGFSAHIIHVCS